LVVLAVLLTLSTARKPDSGGRKIRVVTTLFPLYDFARNIGRDKAEVSLLLPPGVEPHSFEPKPSNVVTINEADVFIYTGKFMEPWAENIIKGLSNKNLIVVDASRGTKMVPGVFRDQDEPAGSLDPHIWLDFDNAGVMVRNIAQAMEEKDPADKSFFQQNAEGYDRRLTELDSEFRASLSNCQDREIVYAGHYAFGYMTRRYGLKYMAAQGVSPDAEPTANDLVALIEQVKKDNLKYIFYEELTSPKIAETIANETHTQMLLLNAAHNVSKAQFDEGVSFLDILKTDLANLKTGLECK
jgi:zinc transport system substrate-binding protein